MVIFTKIILALLYFLAFLLILVAIICVVPFSYSTFLKVCNERIRGNAVVGWGFGIIGARFSFGEKNQYQLTVAGRPVLTRSIELGNISKRSEKKEKQEKKKKPKKKRRRFSRKDVAVRELAGVIKDAFSKLIRILKPKYFRCEGIYGFDDPSITGLVEGLAPIVRNRLNRANIRLQPCFHEEVVDIEIEMAGRMSLISFIALAISTIVKKPVRKLVFSKKTKESEIVRKEDLPSS